MDEILKTVTVPIGTTEVDRNGRLIPEEVWRAALSTTHSVYGYAGSVDFNYFWNMGVAGRLEDVCMKMTAWEIKDSTVFGTFDILPTIYGKWLCQLLDASAQILAYPRFIGEMHNNVVEDCALCGFGVYLTPKDGVSSNV